MKKQKEVEGMTDSQTWDEKQPKTRNDSDIDIWEFAQTLEVDFTNVLALPPEEQAEFWAMLDALPEPRKTRHNHRR